MATSGWRSNWPSSKSVKEWIIASGEMALAIKVPDERMHRLSFAIWELRKRRFRTAAKPLFSALDRDLRAYPELVDGLLYTLPETYIAMGKRARAQQMYAAIINHTKANKKLKPARRERELDYLRKEALRHRFSNLFDDLTSEERTEIAYGDAVERAEAANRRKDHVAARRYARQAEVSLRSTPIGDRRWRYKRLLRIYAEAADRPSALRMLNALDKDDRAISSIGDALLKLGLKELVIDLARKNICSELEDARTMELPNYHFPAMSIARTISVLIEHGEEDEARRLIETVGKEMGSWGTGRSGWVEAAVYSKLALPVARLHGRQAAERMLQVATDAAEADHTSFRSGAWSSIIEVYEQVGAWDEALALARKHGSRDGRRTNMARLLAQAGRWKELADVLRTVQSPTEASEVAWWVAAKLDGL